VVLGADNLIGLPKVNLLKRDEIVVIICKFRARKVTGTSLTPVFIPKSNLNSLFE